MSEMKKRMMTFEMTAPKENKRFESDFYVEGYATTFEPYVLYRGEKPIYEQIHREAFDEAKMDNVIFLYNHEGRVCARMSNETLICEVNERGLFVAADLSKTAYAREIYEDIRCGNISQMSWAFFVSEDGEEIDFDTRTIHIKRIIEVIDVSAVSIPANDQTSISARCKQFEEAESKEAHLKEEIQEKELAQKKAKLRLKLKLGGY